MAFDPKRQLPGGPETINELWFDALIRHQISLLRLSDSIDTTKIFKLLDKAEKDLREQITVKLANHKGLTTPADIRKLDTLMKTIRARRAKAWDEVTEEWLKQLLDLAKKEVVVTDGLLKTVAPVLLDTLLPSPRLLTNIVNQRLFEGRTLKEWSKDIKAKDLRRIEDQIKIGMVQGQTSTQIARRIVGTVRAQGRDGATGQARRQAKAITRTSINAIANSARQEYFKANSRLFTKEQYVATLDERTTTICSSLDGEVFPLGEGEIPPLHFNCRSLRVPFIDGDYLSTRPAKPFTEQQLVRDYSRNKSFPTVSSRDALPHGQKGLYDQFARSEVRKRTGVVPGKTTYQQWLFRQSREFQEDVLGDTKSKLFRDGGLTLKKFVNRNTFEDLTLEQLARKEAAAFRAAGLDPQDFL